ncbi:uncharacterized protein LOC123563544 [Mercenaria mercenaria]|uniref:uncharacterized protein LOC123563544 n=1 Tax=Mercenaria mercenaria TaxID=6596 RepID=UPI00234EC5B5|nr:uncharacterized protein LOC123563544 [Mercenaria mercenaria]
MSNNSSEREKSRRWNNSTAETWNYADISKPAPVRLDDTSHGSLSSTNLAAYDWNLPDTRDILDLQRIAENMAEARRNMNSRQIDEAELRRYTPLAEADFEEIRKTDDLLEQAYDLYLIPALSRAPRVKRKTKALIARLESKPHFYCPYEREEPTKVHVSRWLNKYTASPEEDLLGFTSRDPYEPKKFISTVEPRAVNSDTNVVLGKRKRERDEEETVCVSTSSSESRLVCDHSNRPKKFRRAR